MRLLRWITRRVVYREPINLGCADCCGRGRCHWCLMRPGVVKLATDRGLVWACAAHANSIIRRALNIGEMYDEAARGPVTLRA